MIPIEPLLRKLHYTPQSISLFEQALTHRSYGQCHYERLEFIGDALLDLVIGELLYEQFDQEREGKLTQYRAALVKGEALADLAKSLSLSDYIRLGEGEKKSQGQFKPSILADCFEALMGAIYLDGGFDEAKNIISTLFEQRLSSLSSLQDIKGTKSNLQEYLQKQHLPLPIYSLERIAGLQHEQTFYVRCEVKTKKLSSLGVGSSKKLAEQNAASLMIALMQQEGSL